MNRVYYYLELNGRYEVIAATPESDRLGLIGANFSTATRAQEYVLVLNAQPDEADSEAEGS